MLNLASVLEEKDFTQEEKNPVQLHIDNYEKISWANMSSAWRDKNGILCISYESNPNKIIDTSMGSAKATGECFYYNTELGVWW